MFSNEKESLLKNEQTPSYSSSDEQNTVDTKQPSLNGVTRVMDTVAYTSDDDDDDGGLSVVLNSIFLTIYLVCTVQLFFFFLSFNLI